MFGDAWATDIEGARRAGVRPVWFNRTGAASPDASIHEVRSLSETSRVLEVLLDPLITRHEDMKHMK